MHYPPLRGARVSDRHEGRLLTGLAFERRRTQIPERGVPAPLVIEHLEIVEQLPPRGALAREVLASSVLTVEKKLSMTALS